MINMIIRRGWEPVNAWNFPRLHYADKRKEELLRFILWFNNKSVGTPCFEGITPLKTKYTIDREEVNREIVYFRIRNLRAQFITVNRFYDHTYLRCWRYHVQWVPRT
jgi:hypothetical protein